MGTFAGHRPEIQNKNQTWNKALDGVVLDHTSL
jgi:hypothetical protein